MGAKYRMILWVALPILALDQVSKLLVVGTFALHQSEPIVPAFFHLTYVRNTGAAFGLLAHTPDWFRQPFFLVTTSIAVVALGMLLKHARMTDRLAIIAAAAILAGAIGNLIDRIHYGYVVDFLDFHWAGYHWPAFNVADSGITLGVAGLLWDALRPSAARQGGGEDSA